MNHVRDTVRFHDTVTRLAGHAFVEVGPDAVLTAMAADCLDEPGLLVPTARRDADEAAAFRTALATLHAHGVAVSWPTGPSARVDLPTYAFQRDHLLAHGGGRHPGVRTRCSPPPSTWPAAAPSPPDACRSPPTPGWPTTWSWGRPWCRARRWSRCCSTISSRS